MLPLRLYAAHGFRGKLIDLDTGLPVPRVIWADPDEGLVEAYRVRPDGSPVLDPSGAYVTYRAKGRFKFVPVNTPRRRPPAKEGAAKCTKCTSHLTLPGEELCPACYALDRNVKRPMRVGRLASPILNVRCGRKGCSRVATWSVSDEVAVSPEKKGKMWFERGATVGRRFYCSHHYVPPKILDARGEEVETIEDGGGVRPQ